MQFDSQDPQHVVLDGAPITEVAPLTPRSFMPRGGTPLLDATGLLIDRARHTASQRLRQGLPPEHVLFVTLTDGEENQSRLFTLAGIRERIAERTAAGWTFLFLSAGPDAFTEAAGLGIQRDAVKAFSADQAGTRMAMEHITQSALQFRRERRFGPAGPGDGKA